MVSQNESHSREILAGVFRIISEGCFVGTVFGVYVTAVNAVYEQPEIAAGAGIATGGTLALGGICKAVSSYISQ